MYLQFAQCLLSFGIHAMHAARFWRALFMVRSNNTFAIGIPSPYRPGFSAHRFRAVLNNSARLQALSKARPYLKNAFCSGVIFGLLSPEKFTCRVILAYCIPYMRAIRVVTPVIFVKTDTVFTCYHASLLSVQAPTAIFRSRPHRKIVHSHIHLGDIFSPGLRLYKVLYGHHHQNEP